MIRADERIRAIAAAEDVATLLAVAPGAPLLLVDRVSYTYRDQPVEVRRGFCVTTEHHYRNELF
jgi:GntR family transcriptional regulator